MATFLASTYMHATIYNTHMKHVVLGKIRTLLGCQATLVTEESCLFLISLLTHLEKGKRQKH